MEKTNLINTPDSRPEDRYEDFEQSIIDRFNSLVDKNTPIFTTNSENLWEIYLKNLPIEGRQHYNCNCCRHFIERYGNLAIVTEKGTIESVLWSKEVPSFFKESVKQLRKIVNNSRINGIFSSDERVLGNPQTGIWSHLHIKLPLEKVNKSRLKNSYQIMAEKREEYGMLNRSLQEYSLDIVNQAIQILQSESLYRGDNCLGVAKWFESLYKDRQSCTNSRIKENITWLYVATAREGYCHIKSSMIGTLLDDINDKLSFESIKRRFDEKMNPSNYMRSQSAPTQGGIQQAEKVVERLGIADSLRRRYAKFEEIPEFIWKNNNKETKSKEDDCKNFGVFANITPKGKTKTKVNNIEIPTTVMTWDKFKRTILPTAENIEVKVDNPDRLMALVTASVKDSENILQWDNQFSWYYHGGIDSEIRQRVENAGGRYENNDIRCSLIWEGYTDLDLHCITPRGQEIYWSDKRKESGYLDIDMNGIDRNSPTPVENIRWATGEAPNGHYRFFVHNYSERTNGYEGTPFKVELEINGKIYSYIGEPLRNKNKITVFEFDYIIGQEPIINNSNSVSIDTNEEWNLQDEFIKVNGITTSPNLWGDNQFSNKGKHIFFILDKCKDLSEGKGRGFFNEMLKPELREIRKTLEAYTSQTSIEGLEDANACGLGYNQEGNWDLVLRVTSEGSTRFIKIDRWD
ncbi:hypothetical protein CF087_20565 [Clostridium botulinum]|nr:hypothetical protein [Clostridium botulinum]